MVKPVPPGVESDLIAFFKSRSANPSAITSRTNNVKHLCGFDSNPLGWRGLTGPINQLSHIVNRLRLDPTDMDVCQTIADIEDELRPIAAAKKPVKKLVAKPAKKAAKKKKSAAKTKQRRKTK